MGDDNEYVNTSFIGENKNKQSNGNSLTQLLLQLENDVMQQSFMTKETTSNSHNHGNAEANGSIIQSEGVMNNSIATESVKPSARTSTSSKRKKNLTPLGAMICLLISLQYSILHLYLP